MQGPLALSNGSRVQATQPTAAEAPKKGKQNANRVRKAMAKLDAEEAAPKRQKALTAAEIEEGKRSALSSGSQADLARCCPSS